VSNADQLLAPSLSTLGNRFATICHNYYYVFMTAARLPWGREGWSSNLRAPTESCPISQSQNPALALLQFGAS
jgi:hypothetical protein